MSIFLVLIIVAICAFEFINGFHDTANAVATVIYTKSLPAHRAVLYSGLLNFLGVIIGGVGVAFSIVKLVPVLEITQAGRGVGLIVVISILLTSILWNLYTWKKGLPCSSSHTLIGAIIGAVIGFCLLKVGDFSLVNTGKIKDILLALLISPIFGFGMTLLLVSFFKKFRGKSVLFHRPHADGGTPPLYIRLFLIITCGLVSFFHGSNDGQKGIGFGMVALMILAPSLYLSSLETHVVPYWLIIAVSASLGLGTMIGRKRIVVTIGEKIGVDHLSYIQGALSELVAATAIGVSTHFHMPVSTTHALSSGVAGSMVASGGFQNVQGKTVRNIALAWVFTLPVCIIGTAVLVYIGGLLFGV